MTATKLANEVRPPAVAGAFYPANPVHLTQLIDGYLAEAQRLEPEPSIIIVPHAGYVYSGGVAAHGFKQALDRGYEHVIILGFNHGYAYGFDGAAIWPTGAWRTPLGDVPIDAALAQQILDAGPDLHHRSIHSSRRAQPGSGSAVHSARAARRPIVPISIGRPTLENAQAIADAPGAGAARNAQDAGGDLDRSLALSALSGCRARRSFIDQCRSSRSIHWRWMRGTKKRCPAARPTCTPPCAARAR